MAERYGQRPSRWFDTDDPWIQADIDEAAYDTGASMRGLQEATREERVAKASKTATPTRTVPKYSPTTINAVLGYVPADASEGSEPGRDEPGGTLYDRMMADLDGGAPVA